MINAYTPINNLQYTIYKPIVASMVKHFATKFLRHPDILVIYNENNDMFGEDMINTNYANQYKKEWITVDYEITHDDSYMLTNSIRGNDGINLFRDGDIGFSIQSIPITHTFNITLKVFDKFKNRLSRLLNDFQLGEINDTNYMILNAETFFTVPNNVVTLIKHICDLKYGKNVVDWYKYFERYSFIETDRLNSKSGDSFVPIYRINYNDLAVWTEVGFLDKKIEKEDDGYSLELTLKFSFDVLIGMNLFYPILIANKPIPKEYLIISPAVIKKYNLPIERSLFVNEKINTFIEYLGNNLRNDVIKLLDHIDTNKYIRLLKDEKNIEKDLDNPKQEIMNQVDSYIQMMYNLNQNIKRVVPIYDIWRNYNNYGDYEPVNILLLQVKEKNCTYINLYEMLNLGYSKEFIDTLINNKDKFRLLFNWLFHFNIYIGDDLIPMEELDIAQEDDPDNNLKRGDVFNKYAVDNNKQTDKEDEKLYISLLKPYHFVLYINTNPVSVTNYEDSDLTLLMQYVAMDRLNNIGEFANDLPMRTIMQFSLIANNINGKANTINQILKDLQGE